MFCVNCVNHRVRTKKGIKYSYCTLWKRETRQDECKHCNEKASKTFKKMKKSPIKGKVHRQTKATAIPKKVKEIVWERDKHRCIFCHKEVGIFYANAHFVPRSAGGLGVPENIFTACEDCHTEQDNGMNTEIYDSIAEEYLKSKYPNWNREELIYKKY